ncbi:hypothetical protein BGZ79_010743 [Entomortierella chlamydospora]|nr:hypothetical protein BGZ79_010743 [Entomortierella chlamydospora]
MRRVRIGDEDYYQARAPHPNALRNHSMARPQSPQAGHTVDPTHPHTRYDSQRYYQHDRANHTGRRDVDFEGGPNGNWDDRHAYDHRDSSKVGGSEGALLSTLAPSSQWRDSRRSIRHSVSEPDIQLIELEQRRERHVFDHREDERDKDRLEDAEEGVEGGSEGEFEDEYEYNRLHGRIRRPESSASQHTSPPSVPRMAYEGQRHSQQSYIGDYERGADQGRHFQHHRPRESMTQAELRDPAFRNHRELQSREIQPREMQQQHPYDYPPQNYHHQAPRASHLPPSNATFRPQQHPYMPSHHSFTPQQQQQQQQQQLQQQQQHGSMPSNHPSSSSTFMDNQSSASSAAAGPNRRGPYMSRQRALMAGLETSTPSSRYQCQYCQKRFSRPSSLRIHTYSHTGERPFKCSEEGCGRQFSVQSNMRRHLRVHRLGRMRTDFPRE